MKKIFIGFCMMLFFTSLYGQSYYKPKNAIRIMSYNIRNANGLDNKVDYQRIAEIITKISPDVIALQELDSVTNRSKQIDVLTELASLTTMYSVYGASISFDGGKYGVGILSKIKPLSWKRIALPGREETRSLLIVEFKDYIFCCTHFSLNKDDRQTSISIIDQTVENFNKPVFLAGDINDTPESDVIQLFKQNWNVLTDIKQPTFPADNPKITIDYIFGYSKKYNYSVKQTSVLNEPVASDHLPIFVDVSFNKDNLPPQ